MKKLLTCILITLCHICLLPLQSTGAQQIKIDNIWSRPVHSTVDSQGIYLSNGAVYLTISNKGPADILLSAETDVCQKVELHESKMVNGLMTMNMLKKGLVIPADGVVKLKPGSYHVMLLGIRTNLNPGDTFALTLHFENHAPITVVSVVRNP